MSRIKKTRMLTYPSGNTYYQTTDLPIVGCLLPLCIHYAATRWRRPLSKDTAVRYLSNEEAAVLVLQGIICQIA